MYCDNCGKYVTGYGVGGQACPECGAPLATSAPPEAPSTAFTVSVVGVILSVMLALPGLVCSIIALVLNARYGKRGYYNPRKTATYVLGGIGCAVSTVMLAVSITLTAMVLPSAMEEARQASQASVAEVSASAGVEASGSASAAHSDFHLSDFLENDGAGVCAVLESRGYAYNDDFKWWKREGDGTHMLSIYRVDGSEISAGDAASLGKGGGRAAVMFDYWTTDLDFKDVLSAMGDVDIKAEKQSASSSCAIAVNSDGERYFVRADKSSGPTIINVMTESYVIENFRCANVQELYDVM